MLEEGSAFSQAGLCRTPLVVVVVVSPRSVGKAWVDGVCVLLGKGRWKSLKQPVDLKAFMKAAFRSELLGSHKTQAALPAQDLKQCVHMHAHTWTKSHLCVQTSYAQAHMSAHLLCDTQAFSQAASAHGHTAGTRASTHTDGLWFPPRILLAQSLPSGCLCPPCPPPHPPRARGLPVQLSG